MGMTGNVDFDVGRAILEDKDVFPRFVVQQTQSLQSVLAQRKVKPGTKLVMLARNGRSLTMVKGHLAYHHTAQGELAGEPWLMSFCGVCNSGVSFSPVVDGRLHHFAAKGLYNGLSLLGDDETGSYWDHITGECVYGPMLGRRLPLFPLWQTTVSQALAQHPEAYIALPRVTLKHRLMGWLERGRVGKRGHLPSYFRKTMGEPDARRPLMDMGLGVWRNGSQRYYPREAIKANGNLILDAFAGRTLAIFIDPVSGVPTAFFTTAASGHWAGGKLVLESGQAWQNGRLWDADGTEMEMERPLQLFTRWYGFAYTFPDCEIYTGQTQR